MNKKQFIRAIAKRSQIDGTAVAAVLAAVITETADGLAKDGAARVPGLVTLTAKEYAARPGRNPKTGEPCEVPAATRIRVRPSSELEKEFAQQQDAAQVV